jgi:hypothetical protein
MAVAVVFTEVVQDQSLERASDTLPSRFFFIFITCCWQNLDNAGGSSAIVQTVWNRGGVRGLGRKCGNNETGARSAFGFASAVYYLTERGHGRRGRC